MAKISPSILSLEFFCKNSIYLRVRLCERFVNPQLLKQLAVYKIKEGLFYKFRAFLKVCDVRSFIISPAIIRPATEGTKEHEPGASESSSSS